jgi:hypothetical protein
VIRRPAAGEQVTARDWTQIEDRLFAPARVTRYAAVLCACYLVFMLAGLLQRLWLIDPDGAGISRDFVATWAAGHLALEGRAAAAYDLPTFLTAQLQAVARLNGDYTWAYPPPYFLLAAPLALFSYPVAFGIWIAATFTAYLAAIRALVPVASARNAAILAAAASPFVLWNAFAGQNGFLTAALIAGTLAFLDRRPILAGILLGLLTLKPHFGLLFPLVLILTGRWRVFAAAAVTAVVLALISAAAFGLETWTAFLPALRAQGDVVLARGHVDFVKQQSVHALVRTFGGGEALAWSLHILAAAAAAVFAVALWVRRIDWRLQAAALVTASLVATPYLFIYDLPILSVPLILLAWAGGDLGYVPGERTLIAFLMVVLLLLSGVPMGVPLLALTLALIVARLMRAKGATA